MGRNTVGGEGCAPVTIRVDAGEWLGPLPHNWNYIGYDECNYTYTPEGQELLAEFAAFQEKPYYVRVHHLLCTGNCHGTYKWGSTNAYLEDELGNPRYDWTYVDLILDTILAHGCKPFVELGFMPKDLADPARYDTSIDRGLRAYREYGWACPPKDYGRWQELIYRLVRHAVERYGEDEVASWYWELWNEPDIHYWRGTVDQFLRLYDHTAAGVKAALPQARVGGPSVTDPAYGRRSAEYLEAFLAHCTKGTNASTGERGAPLDFVTFHLKGGGYGPDPLHRPQKPPSVRKMLQGAQVAHEIIAQHGLAGLECVVSECDPDGWAAGGAWDNAALNFRNTEYYPSFVATAFHKLTAFALERAWDLRFLSWAFLFVGERCFEGTRAFSTQGIDKPILNLLRMYARLGDRQVRLVSSAAKDPLGYADPWGSEEDADVSGLAALAGGKGLQVLVYHHHDDWARTGGREVTVEVEHLPFASGELTLRHYRIDGAHSNAYAEWVRQGRPMYPSASQRQALRTRAGLELVEAPRSLAAADGRVTLQFTLPLHGISLLEISSQG